VKSTVFVQPHSEKFGLYQRRSSNQLFFVLPRSAANFWNCDKEHCVLFSRAAKDFGIY
jgi:hypothetical protein